MGLHRPRLVLKELRVPYENALIAPEHVQKSEFCLMGLQAMLEAHGILAAGRDPA